MLVGWVGGGCHLEAEAQGAEHPEHGVELGAGPGPHGLVEALPAQAGLLGDPLHPVGAGHFSQDAQDAVQVARFQGGVQGKRHVPCPCRICRGNVRAVHRRSFAVVSLAHPYYGISTDTKERKGQLSVWAAGFGNCSHNLGEAWQKSQVERMAGNVVGPRSKA